MLNDSFLAGLLILDLQKSTLFIPLLTTKEVLNLQLKLIGDNILIELV